ncbi:MAG: RNA 2',3'-cyclic phosphodiesterase, partial [Gammaproteobacteria bacterium]
HLTLVFLGNVTADVRNCLSAAAALLHVPRFTLALDQLCYWAKPRIVWLGASRVPDALQALVDGLNGALTKCGLTPEPRGYQPHITLLRKADRSKGEFVIQPFEWKADRFCLVESSNATNGVVYRILNSWNLD